MAAGGSQFEHPLGLGEHLLDAGVGGGQHAGEPLDVDQPVQELTFVERRRLGNDDVTGIGGHERTPPGGGVLVAGGAGGQVCAGRLTRGDGGRPPLERARLGCVEDPEHWPAEPDRPGQGAAAGRQWLQVAGGSELADEHGGVERRAGEQAVQGDAGDPHPVVLTAGVRRVPGDDQRHLGVRRQALVPARKLVEHRHVRALQARDEPDRREQPRPVGRAGG